MTRFLFATFAFATVEYLLISGASRADGQTIGVEGDQRFRIKARAQSAFGAWPVLALEGV